ncbi:MAG: phosphoadenosine phosphosulfate reductase family protein, partial [Bacillota bacterium]
MRVFWCTNCEVPVLYSERINEETVEENPYLDIEDEVIEWGLNNGFGEEYYNKFLSLKSNIKSMINNKSLKEIKDKIYETDVNLKSEQAIDKLKEFAKKYANIKFMNSNSEPAKTLECPHCKEETLYVGKDIRPVFMGERIVLSVLLEKDFKEENIWHASGSRYVIDGKTTDIKLKNIYNVANLEKKKELIREKIKNCNEEVDFSKFIEVNNEHFRNIDNKAIDFIENGSEFFSERMEVVSFSGGKDSTVVSDLVRRALNARNMLHIFGDTTLEFPYTYEYIQRLKDDSKPSKRRTFLSVDKPNKSFYQLAEKFGPPSRVMSWCCNIFKTGPIGNLFKQIANENKILTYYGVRRSESSSRSKYDKVSQSPKIAKQLVLSPIIDWH